MPRSLGKLSKNRGVNPLLQHEIKAFVGEELAPDSIVPEILHSGASSLPK